MILFFVEKSYKICYYEEKVRNGFDVMKFKKVIYPIVLITWMIVIFLFSNQNAIKSQSTSDQVASKIIDTVTTVLKQPITKKQKNNLIEDTRILVRKTAHFTLYFILGIFMYLTLDSYSIPKPLLYGILFCFLYAISDEIHQLFLAGRTAKIVDILIDTTGASIGNFLIYKIKK